MVRQHFSIALAICVSSKALALTPSVTPDLTLQISGSAIVDKQIETYVNNLCDLATLDSYSISSNTSKAWFCNVPAANSGLGGDKKLVIHKENGGSVSGVTPISLQGTVSVLDLSSCLETAPDSKTWDCSATTNLPAQVGVSDVEPELFSILANGSYAFDQNTQLTVQAIFAQTFGVVVSPPLRDALQAAQGLYVGSDEIADMPSLSSALIANIFGGMFTTWNQLKDENGFGIGSFLAGDKEAINVCRRTSGSGTQAQFNAFVMKNPCAYRGAGDLGFQGINTALDINGTPNDIIIPELFPGFPLPPPYIHENDSSSDLGKCVTDVTANGSWAIGIQSMAKVDEGRTDRNNFKYIAVDGITPTLENVAAGLYQNWGAATIQWNNNVVTGDVLTLAQKLVVDVRNQADVYSFNQSLQVDDMANPNDDRPIGGFNTPEIIEHGVPVNVGMLVFAKNAGEVPSHFDPTTPVTPFNRRLISPSTCALQNVAPNSNVDVSQTR